MHASSFVMVLQIFDARTEKYTMAMAISNDGEVLPLLPTSNRLHLES
jgi:hypothetical protein